MGQFRRGFVVLLGAAVLPLSIRATVPDPADHSFRQFLAQNDEQRPYRASRRLEAVNGDRTGWIEATTEFSPQTGFRYEVTAEGGSSSYIRTKVLRALLDGERDLIAQGEAARSALAPVNYTFQANGVDAEGLANVLLSPRRADRLLVKGTLFLRVGDGELVRLRGRMAKSPSFWIKTVDIARAYQRVNGMVVPTTLDASAELRLLGHASLRMTYEYLEVDGRPVVSVCPGSGCR
jgi:hypothetical protein